MASSAGDSLITKTGFHTRTDGFLYCDDVRVADVHRQLMTSGQVPPASPAFLYSRRQIERNVRAYCDAFKVLPVPAKLNFSMKSNHNLQILKLIRSLGCGVTLVSGMELQVALRAGFEPKHMLLNGSGKAQWEISEAVRRGVLMNIDSEFDVQKITEACNQQGEETIARVLLRLNLDIDPKVHKYNSTGAAGSKFGLGPAALTRVTDVLTSDSCPMRVEGLHCHLGSTIQDTSVFRESVRRLLTIRQELKAKGFEHLHLINVGGGLAIDYMSHREETFPYREEEEGQKEELNRLMDHLQREVTSAGDSDRHRSSLFQDAVDVLTSYIQERIPRRQLDTRLWELFERLGIKDSISQTFPQIWREKVTVPTPTDLINTLRDVFVTSRDNDVTVLFEPGRSIVGNAGALMTTVLGFKTAGTTKFLIVDGAMNDVIRPSLYNAYHHIHPASPPYPITASSNNATTIATRGINTTITNNTTIADHSTDDNDDKEAVSASGGCGEGQGQLHVLDVVGPVCESGDFLGKNRLFPLPEPGACLVVRDTGAYCSSTASNYNLRLRAAEIMVDGSEWRFIRRPDNLEDLLAPYLTVMQY